MHKIFNTEFRKLYPLYLAKAERKGRTKAEVDGIIHWLFGYTQSDLETITQGAITVEEFITACPKLQPDRVLITGVVCGVRVETIEDPLMKEIRYLDKLIDELAKGRPMEKILLKAAT